jgi:hypothetical protein
MGRDFNDIYKAANDDERAAIAANFKGVLAPIVMDNQRSDTQSSDEPPPIPEPIQFNAATEELYDDPDVSASIKLQSGLAAHRSFTRRSWPRFPRRLRNNDRFF